MKIYYNNDKRYLKIMIYFIYYTIKIIICFNFSNSKYKAMQRENVKEKKVERNCFPVTKLKFV